MEIEEPLNGEYGMEVDIENIPKLEENGKNRFTKCPSEIINRISQCLNVNDLFNLSLCCKFLNKFARSELQRRRLKLFNGQRNLKTELFPPMFKSGRYGHCICYHAPHNRVYVCGGRTDQGAILNDMSYFDLDKQRWEKKIYADSTRFMPSKCLYASLCSYKDNLILFGGYHYDSTPATGLCKIFTLNLIAERWFVTFCPAIIKNLHGHSSIMHKDGYMITFGGHTMNSGDGGGNEMYSLECGTSIISVVNQLNDRPPPRVFPALAFADNNNLVVVGGRTSIEDAYQILNDAFLFTFTNKEKTEGFWTPIEVEGLNLWPSCSPTFSQAGNILYMISQPMDTTHILVDNELIFQLYNSKQAHRQFEKENGLQICCSDPLAPVRRRDSVFGITSGRYLYDVSLSHPDNRPVLQGQILRPNDLSNEQSSLVNDCYEAIHSVYSKRQVFLSSDDIQCILLWLNLGRHTNKCKQYKLGAYKSCSGVCFKVGGCIYEVLRKYFLPNGEEFLQQLCAILYHFTGHSQRDFISLDYPVLKDCSYWSGQQIGNVIPLTEFLKLQSLIPVHRAFFDAPLTATVYKLDLRDVIEKQKIRLTQDPVRFMAPLFNKYASMTFTGNGFLLCGGVTGEWNNLVENFPNNPRRPATDTIFIS